MADIDIGNALWSGLINYANLTKKEQAAYECAYEFFKGFEKQGIDLATIEKGGIDCIISFSARYTLKYLRDTNTIKSLAQSIADAKQYDMIIKKLSEVISKDDILNFIEILTENGIKKGVEPLWAKK